MQQYSRLYTKHVRFTLSIVVHVYHHFRLQIFPCIFLFFLCLHVATLLALLGIKIANFRVTGNVAQLYLSLIYTKIRDIANRAIYSHSFETPNLSLSLINLELELPLFTRHIWFTLSIVIHVYHHFRLQIWFLSQVSFLKWSLMKISLYFSFLLSVCVLLYC